LRSNIKLICMYYYSFKCVFASSTHWSNGLGLLQFGVGHLSWECMTYDLRDQNICPKGIGHVLKVQDILLKGVRHLA